MANETILKYLKVYKDKYPLDQLKRQILEKHYTEEEYYEALKEISESKFRDGEVSKLPNTNIISEKKKKKEMSWIKLVIILLLIIMFGFGLIVLYNYLGYDFFTFNFFDLFK